MSKVRSGDSEIAISIRNLGKRYPIGRAPLYGKKTSDLPDSEEFWSLRDVTLEVPKGEILGIVGKNGAGKSTLLKILAGIVQPSTGEVDIYGNIGSLLELGTGLHPELTGRENIFLYGAIIGMARRETESAYDEIVGFSDIGRFINQPLKHYSTGMQLRLAFSVAIHCKPEILLLDEVLAVGDISFQQKCLEKMKAQRKAGRTVLFVSHDLLSMQKICDRAILIHDGTMVAESDPITISIQYVEMMKAL